MLSTSHIPSIYELGITGIGFESSFYNGTRPVVYSPNGHSFNLPANAFPSARLASALTPDKSITYLYHQMIGTTFAEDTSVSDWGTSTYINVLPSAQSSISPKIEAQPLSIRKKAGRVFRTGRSVSWGFQCYSRPYIHRISDRST